MRQGSNNVLTPQFKSEDVRNAAGLTHDTFRNWLRDFSMVLPRDAEGHYVFSFADALRLALQAELVRVGLPPKPARVFAVKFCDTGFADGDMATRRGEPDVCRREVGRLFPNGETLLVITPGQKGARVVNIVDGSSLRDAINGRREQVSGALILFVNEIWDSVEMALGLPPDWLD